MGMLSVSKLEKELKESFNNAFPVAFKQALLTVQGTKSEDGDKKAELFGKCIDDLLSEDLAKNIAAAIDYYVKSIPLGGTIITVGSMVTQTAMISPMNIANPTAGLVPNTIGMQGMYE